MDVRGAVYKGEEDEEDDVLGGGPVPARTRTHDSTEQRRRNFRSATFAYSSDRTTIEDMADHVISRFERYLILLQGCQELETER